MTSQEIKEEVKLIYKGFDYVDKSSEAEIEKFMPRLQDKMRNVCLMAQQLERETGGKFNWDTLELSEPEQISFKCGL